MEKQDHLEAQKAEVVIDIEVRSGIKNAQWFKTVPQAVQL